jgi:HD superfamily phosphohydrolase
MFKEGFSDNIHGFIYYSSLEKRIIETKLFSRLHNVYQSSTVYLTFPATKTKRYEHSIGTMKIAGDYFASLIRNSDQQISNRYLSTIGNYLDLESKRFRVPEEYIYVLSLPNTIDSPKNRYIFYVYLQALRLAALLHDVGHPPFSHVIEDTITKIFSLDIVKDPVVMKNFNINQLYTEFQEKKLHEQIGLKFQNFIVKEYLRKDDNFEHDVAIAFKMIVGIEVIKVKEKIKYNSIGLIKKIISSNFDADRFDFLQRDSINSGVPNVNLEIDRILGNVKIKQYPEGFQIAYGFKTITTLDNIMYQRNFIYNSINFHHNSIKVSMLLENAIIEIATHFFLELKEGRRSKNLINDRFLDTKIDDFLFLIESFMNANLDDIDDAMVDKLSQWDDNWLIVFLRRNLYRNTENIDIEDICEVIEGKKVFRSIIKRSNDCSELNKKYCEVFIREIQTSKFRDVYNRELISDRNAFSTNLFLSSSQSKFSDNFESRKNVGYILKLFRKDMANIVRNVQNEINKENKLTVRMFLKDRGIGFTENEKTELYDGVNNKHLYKDQTCILDFIEQQNIALPPIYIYTKEKVNGDKIVDSDLKELCATLLAKRCVEYLLQTEKKYNI